MKSKGRLLCISGPSGIGKNYLINQLVNTYPDKFEYIPSSTTKPNPHDGTNDYIYLSNEEYENIKTNNGFINDEGGIYSARYGYTKDIATKVFKSGEIGIITPYGPIIGKVVEAFREVYDLEVYAIYLRPENLEFVKDRMIKRGRETLEKIHVKLKDAERELSLLQENKKYFDEVFVIKDNDIQPVLDWIRKTF